jgi:putative Mg2+ transporter-C (MgtC) family protein
MPQPLLLYPEDLIKLLAAFFLGSLLGFEREFHHKFAGLRTIILICVGACLFSIFSYRLAGDMDPTRIAAAVVTGVGFIGAGVIIHEGGEVRGLTTASTIWLAAALGIGTGGGYLLFSLIATLLALLVLWGLPRLERRIGGLRVVRTYRVTTAADAASRAHVHDQFRRASLTAEQESEEKRGAEMTGTWVARGSPEEHRRLADLLLSDPQVLAYEGSLPG